MMKDEDTSDDSVVRELRRGQQRQRLRLASGLAAVGAALVVIGALGRHWAGGLGALQGPSDTRFLLPRLASAGATGAIILGGVLLAVAVVASLLAGTALLRGKVRAP